MGGGASMLGTETVRKEWMDVFKAMKLQRGEVKSLLNIYNKVDADRSGSIDVVELLTLLDIERTKFTERIFSAFDKDHTGKIDFYEFVVSLWKFCALGNGSLNVFAFDLYDTDADGKLQSEQVHKMFREMMGAKMMDNENTKAGMAELLKKAVADELSIEVFIPYCKYHQALLAPVFKIQEKLRRVTLGGQAWEAVSMRKIEVHTGRTMPIRELMVLHSDRRQFRGLLEDRSALRVSSMMRIVLDNTDNAPRPTTPPASPSQQQQGRRKTILDPTYAQTRRGSVQKDREVSIERTSTRSSHSHSHSNNNSHYSLPSVAVPAAGTGTAAVAVAPAGAGAHATGHGAGHRESAKHQHQHQHGTPSARHALPKSLLHATGGGD